MNLKVMDTAQPDPDTISRVPVVLPVGGQGSRALPTTRDRIPKHLIKLGRETTVLGLIIRNLLAIGFRTFVFCIGNHGRQIRQYVHHLSREFPLGSSFQFCDEDQPLGGDGAVLHAKALLGMSGPALIMPGDLLLPWRSVASMTLAQVRKKIPLLVGVTTTVTPRTTDVGAMLVSLTTSELVHCYVRGTKSETPAEVDPSKVVAATSAGIIAVDLDAYDQICGQFVGKTFNLRDDFLTLPLSQRTRVECYDLHGEILDLGTPQNIAYGRKNWRRFDSTSSDVIQ